MLSLAFGQLFGPFLLDFFFGLTLISGLGSKTPLGGLRGLILGLKNSFYALFLSLDFRQNQHCLFCSRRIYFIRLFLVFSSIICQASILSRLKFLLPFFNHARAPIRLLCRASAQG